MAIARAMVGERRLLLADEPSGALDSGNAEAVMRLVHEACKNGGMAAVVVTHDAQLASWADRVVFLRDGRVTDQTAPAGRSRVAAHARAAAVSVRPRRRGSTRAAGCAGAGNGGVPARRAVIRWAWRLLRREWRQQLLILALITVAVAATFVGSAVATNTPPPAGAGFGTATDMATLGPEPRPVRAEIAALAHRFGRVDVIENQTIPVPGSVLTYSLRAQNPHGPFGQPMLSLASGHYPAGPGQVALTSGVASELHLGIGDTWRGAGAARRVVGIVANPQNLLDEFALVAPGQVSAPSQVTVLFDAPGVNPRSLGPNVTVADVGRAPNVINPVTISLAAATLGMLLIALVGVGGFTVLAQRRLRSIGMLGAQGATNANVGLVVSANGFATGVVGAVAGFALGLAAWLAYRPHAEASAHHVMGAFQLPWLVIFVSMALAVLAAYLAAVRPARAIAQVPIVAALAGRPPAPRQARRWAGPTGVGLLVLAFFLIGLASEQATSTAAEARQQVDALSRPGRRPDRAVRRGSAGRPDVPGAAGQGRPAGPGSRAAGAARPGQVPGALGGGARRDQPQRAHRGHHLRDRRRAVRQRRRLRRAQPGFESAHRLPAGGSHHPERAMPARAERVPGPDRRPARGDGGARPGASRPRSGPGTSSGSRRLTPRCSAPRPGGPGTGLCTWPLRSCCARTASPRRRSARTPTSSPCGLACRA